MKNLTYTEKRILIGIHVRDGYTYQEALELVKKDCEEVKELTKTNRKAKSRVKMGKKKLFDKEFKKMKNEM